MLSRVADNLYWMSRYLERAEHTARVMGVQLNLMLEQDPRTSSRRWLRTLGALGNSTPVAANQDPFAPAQIYALRQITGGIASARENARQVREQISSEMWEHLNRLFHEVKRIESAGFWTRQPLDFVSTILESSHLFQGVTDSTMNHGEGWQFIQVGRYLERAMETAMLLDAYHDDLWSKRSRGPLGNEYLEWMGLLRSATAFEAYCKVYTADLTPERILEFLLLNAEFPHSLRFSVESMQGALRAVQERSGGARAEALTRLAGRMQATLAYVSVDEILDRGVIPYLQSVQGECSQLHRMLYSIYVDYSVQSALADSRR